MSAVKHEPDTLLEQEYARMLARTERPAPRDVYSADDTRPAELVENLAGALAIVAVAAGFWS